MSSWKKITNTHRVGILGTVIFHLLVAILFVGLNIARPDVHAAMEITLEWPDEEALHHRVEALHQREELLREQAAQEVREIVRSIAVNEEITTRTPAQKLPVEREIDRYIAGIQEELNEGASGEERYAAKRDGHHDADSLRALEERRQRELDSLQATVYAGESSVSYRLQNRYKTFLPIPVFRCEFGGKVVVAITVNPRGVVLKAAVIAAESKDDDCLREVAVEAATRSRFNEDEKAPPRQTGTITYQFVKQ
ncbi:MAG: energy transducer TonB [Odoribacteraceae bacterium]|jgi:hypothetical protein|nr:energy transducer TonB [Odoribacteraceae bacterium]